MRAALIIASKDLRQRARDRSLFLMAIVVPLFLAFIFSQIFSGVSGDSVTFDYAVVDQDGGDIARVLVDEVLVSLEEDGLVELIVAESLEQGRRLAANGDVSATFIIPRPGIFGGTNSLPPEGSRVPAAARGRLSRLAPDGLRFIASR